MTFFFVPSARADAGRVPSGKKQLPTQDKDVHMYDPLPALFVDCFQRALFEAGKTNSKIAKYYVGHGTNIRKALNHWRHTTMKKMYKDDSQT